MENNMWILTLSAVALVAIVAVFRMVQMTGYMSYQAQQNAAPQAIAHATNVELTLFQVQIENALRTMDPNAKCLWTVFRYGEMYSVGAVAINEYGQVDHMLTTTVYNQMLGIKGPSADIYIINPDTNMGILGGFPEGNEVLGINVGGDETVR